MNTTEVEVLGPEAAVGVEAHAPAHETSVSGAPVQKSGEHEDAQEHRAHHYDSNEHQYESAKFGIWLFLATEILMFSGLFCALAVLGNQYREGFRWGRHLLSVDIGFTNTLVLITSSFTMAWAVRAAMKN